MRRILFVDDDPVILSAYMLSFKQTADARIATNGQHALSLLDNGFNPDIIVTDISMKVMDGIKLSAACSEKYPNIPILFISGDENISEIARTCKAAGWLPKPVGIDAVEFKIQSILCPVPDMNANELRESMLKCRMILEHTGQEPKKFEINRVQPNGDELASHALWLLEQVGHLLDDQDIYSAHTTLTFVHAILWSSGAFSLSSLHAVGATSSIS